MQISLEFPSPRMAARFGALISAHKGSICIWLAFAVLLFLTTFPPWVKIVPARHYRFIEEPEYHRKLWHAPIFAAPLYGEAVEIDYLRLLTEIAVGEAFTGCIYITWARRHVHEKEGR